MSDDELCPRDGQTWAWHSYREPNAGVNGQGRTNAEFVRCDWVPKSLTAPAADWSSVWAELTGYVTEARDDGERLDADRLLSYMAELKRRALAPARDWLHDRSGVTGN